MTGAKTLDWDEQEFTEVRPGVFGATVHLSAGQLAALPGGVRHSATVPADADAVTLHIFTHRERTPGV
jgi:cupin superfamily acireductone dioxygenase involved in methionine salvage